MLYARTRGLIEDWVEANKINPAELRLDEDSFYDGPEDREYMPHTGEITVIFDGAYDESFYVGLEHADKLIEEVLIPDVKAEAESQADAEHPVSFSVYLNQWSGEEDYADSELVRRWDVTVPQ